MSETFAANLQTAPEVSIARDLARRAAITAPLVAGVLGIWLGAGAALGVLLAAAIVSANFMVAATILEYCSRISYTAVMAGALGGFIFRLAAVTVAAIGVKQLSWVDFQVFIVSLVLSHIVLLFWELRSVSLSLAYPGLAPNSKEIG